MTPTLIDKFEYGTWTVKKNPKETMTRLGYRYGHLALLRTDFMCPACEEPHEMWSVANLVSGVYPFPNAVFNNIDDGLSYIYTITPLASWDSVTLEQTRKLAGQLLKTCLDHNGIPIKALAILVGESMGEGVEPGTVAGLNGYTKQ